jgi:hypothetical protein
MVNTMNPYFINEPAAISFSGGRTSAFMLYKVLEAHDGKLPDDVKVTFANTGKEMPQTLDFVQACSDNWDVDIVWLEFDGLKPPPKVVNYDTAARNGEPFDLLTTEKKYLPNMVARFCTQQLKIIPIEKYMGEDFLTVVGIRADEPRRVAKQRQKPDYLVPLADDSVTVETVRDFWEDQVFGLDLPMMPNGVSNASNCDLCFLKGGGIKKSIIREKPELADWWIEQEKKIGGYFRSDQPSYEQMKIIATDQMSLFDFDDESIPCFCGD